MTRTLLVTGASGHLGRSALQHLLAMKLKDTRIIAATRDPSKLSDVAGVEVRRADFDDVASLQTAFAGVDRALLISTDTLDRPGRRVAQHHNAIQAFAQAKVKHVVYTSLVNPHVQSPITIATDHRQTEEALQQAPFGHTVLRNNLYMDLFLGSLPGVVASGTLATASGEGRISYVAREDCARVAAFALAAAFDGRRTLDVTGPEAHSGADVAKLVAALAERPVAFVPLPAEAMRQAMVGHGLPAPVAALLVSFDEGAARGDLAAVADTVAAETSTAPTSLRQFLTQHRAAWCG